MGKIEIILKKINKVGRMRVNIFLLIALIILIAILGYRIVPFLTEGRSYYFKHTDSIDLSNESFGQVRLNDNIKNQSFIKRFGKPLSMEDNDLYDYYHWEGGLETASINSGKNKGDIIRIIINESDGVKKNTRLKTAKGIEIGSTKREIIALYGSSYYKRSEQGVDIIGYVDHKYDVTIEFWLIEGDRVGEIRLDYANIN